MPDRHVLVLAAGKGTRMRTTRPKVLHRLAGHTLIEHVLHAAGPLAPASTTIVVGHQGDKVRHLVSSFAPSACFVHQQPQLGTAHAILQAEPVLAGKTGTLVVLSGDAPLINSQTLLNLVTTHESSTAAATVLTARLDRPYGYGRIIRRKQQLLAVIEEIDATTEQRTIKEVNSGIYAFDLRLLLDALPKVPDAGPKHERYLPAVLELLRRQQLTVSSVITDEAHEIRGINSQSELAEVSAIVRQRKYEELMAAGVTIEDPATTYIDSDVQVGTDTVIHPGVFLEGRTTVGARCELHSGVRIVNSTIGDDVTVNNYSVITDSAVNERALVGPFAHIRPDSTVGIGAKVGNFVELKKAYLATGAKANHLSYIGDATVGVDSNIGAGTITCNYDGVQKHETNIEANVFIGSGTELVAPVTIGQGAYVAAGSCVTDDVPPGALALARGRQVNKENRAPKVKKKAD